MGDGFSYDPEHEVRSRSASRDPASAICDNNHHAVRDMVNHEAVLRQLGAAEAVSAGGDGEGQHARLLATVVGQEPTKPRAICFPSTRGPPSGSPDSRATALDTSVRIADITGMNYDEFTRSFLVTLRDSGLRPLLPEERVGLRSGSQTFSIGVEPLDEEVGEQFHVGAANSFEWGALQAARSATTHLPGASAPPPAVRGVLRDGLKRLHSEQGGRP